MRYYCEGKEEVLKQVQSSEKGLSTQEAQKRLEENGRNALEAAKGKSLFRRFLPVRPCRRTGSASQNTRSGRK